MTAVANPNPPTTAVRFGLLLGNQRRLPDLRDQYTAVRAEAALALEHGIELLVAPEHLDSPPYRMLRAWPLLAALRADLGSADVVGSVVAGLTTPALLTADIESVAGIGTGRVGVALAAGYHRPDFSAAGRDVAARWTARAKARETLRDLVDDDLRWSAASTPLAAGAAGRDGWAWYGPATLGEDAAAELTEAAGRPGVLRVDVLLGDRDRDLEDRWKHFVAPKYGALDRWGFATASARAVLAGTPDEIAAQLATRAAAAVTVVVRLCWPDMEPAEARDHVRRFCRDVIPHVRAADTRSAGRH